MKRFRIELLIAGKKANIYTIRFEGEKENETRKFFLNHSSQYSRQLQIISELLKNIANRRGATNAFVKVKEGKLCDAVVALPNLPHQECELRLYGWKISPQTLIVFNGGIKDKDTYNEIPELNKIVNTLQRIGEIIDEKSRAPFAEIQLNGNNLDGIEDYFDLED